MTSPVYFKLPSDMRNEVGQWLTENALLGNVSYEWPKGLLGFELEEDAIAFTLRFGIHRHITKIEELIGLEVEEL